MKVFAVRTYSSSLISRLAQMRADLKIESGFLILGYSASPIVVQRMLSLLEEAISALVAISINTQLDKAYLPNPSKKCMTSTPWGSCYWK
jgi:hypothetical protein